MKPLKISVLGGLLAVILPGSVLAFGFGMTNDDYYGPWGPYGPYGPHAGNPPSGYPPPAFQPRSAPPYGPPPGARDVRGMWGSGPLMQWGSKDKDEKPKKRYEPYQKLREPWEWSRPWPSMLGNEPQQTEPRLQEAPAEPKRLQPASPQRRPDANYGARGQVYPGWERYQQGAGSQ